MAASRKAVEAMGASAAAYLASSGTSINDPGGSRIPEAMPVLLCALHTHLAGMVEGVLGPGLWRRGGSASQSEAADLAAGVIAGFPTCLGGLGATSVSRATE